MCGAALQGSPLSSLRAGAAAAGAAAAAAVGYGQDDAVHGPNRPVLQPALAAGLAAPAPASCHVLLVDDERLTRTMVSTLLQKCGYRGERAGRREGRLFARSQAPAAPPGFQALGRQTRVIGGARRRAVARQLPPPSAAVVPPRPAPPALPQRHRLLLRPHTLQSPAPAMAWRRCSCLEAARQTRSSWCSRCVAPGSLPACALCSHRRHGRCSCLASNPPCCPPCLQDVCMPELNGLQLLNCVKSDANLRAVPVSEWLSAPRW